MAEDSLLGRLWSIAFACLRLLIPPAIRKSPVFIYLSFFIVVYCGGGIFVIPFLLVANFSLSLALIAQSFIRVGPLSRKRWLGEALAGLAIRAQKVIQNVIAGWGTAVHVFLIFPLSMWFTFVAGSYLTLPEGIRNAILGLPKRLGAEEMSDRLDSTEKVIVWLWRSFKDALHQARLQATGSITMLLIPHTVVGDRLSPALSALLWKVVSSPGTDMLVLCIKRIRSRGDRALRWIQGFIAVVILTPTIYFGTGSNGTGAVFTLVRMQLQVFLAPLGLVYTFLNKFRRAAEKLDRQEYSDKQHGNAIIYDGLSVRPDGIDNPSSRPLIRLLTINPGGLGQLIDCRLDVADLAPQKLPPYEALSYVWGPPDLAKGIFINSQPFAVSTALYKALLRLRNETEPRTIWIDAICMNQDDLAERSAQVLLMQRIYSQASRVVVWLGEEEPWGFKHLIKAASHDLDAEKCRHYGAVRVAANILQRPWWTRVWITQELVLASDVQVRCGSQVVEWERLCWIVDSCSSNPSFPRNKVYMMEFQALHDNRKQRQSAVRNEAGSTAQHAINGGQLTTRATDLLSLIYDFRSRKATDPHDKVFAFQGLAQRVQDLTIATEGSIDLSNLLVRPDYSRRDSLLCIDFARRHIRYTKSLSVVALAECARQEYPSMPDPMNDNRAQYIPSWCPAFMHVKGVQARLGWKPFWTGLPEDNKGKKFSAAGGVALNVLPPDPSEFESSSPRLGLDEMATINGYPHKLDVQILPGVGGTVVELGPVAGGSINKLVDETMKVIDRRSSTMVSSFQGRMSWDSVLPTWRLMAKDAYDSRWAKTGTGNDLCFEELFQLTVTAGRFGVASEANVPQANTEGEAYLSASQAACRDRCLFVTDNGLFGIGPSEIRVGDEVRAILGLQVPAILRDMAHCEERREGGCEGYDPNDWLYIGQAYVHEMMVCDDELLNGMQKGFVQLETRVLT